MTAPLSEGERAAIEARHRPIEWYRPVRQTLHGWTGGDTGPPECVVCRKPWPCDTEKMRAALVAAEADVREVHEQASEWFAQAQASEARAKALAWTVERLGRDEHRYQERPCETCSDVTEALDQPFGCVARRPDLRRPPTRAYRLAFAAYREAGG